MLLLSGTPPLKVDVRVEYVTHEMGSGIRIDLRSAEGTVYKNNYIAKSPVGTAYDLLFQRLLEAQEQSGEELSKILHFVIRNPAYITPPILELSNMEHGLPGLKDTEHFLELCTTLKDCAVRSTCFSMRQFKT